jgi:hypothetical protein
MVELYPTDSLPVKVCGISYSMDNIATFKQDTNFVFSHCGYTSNVSCPPMALYYWHQSVYWYIFLSFLLSKKSCMRALHIPLFILLEYSLISHFKKILHAGALYTPPLYFTTSYLIYVKTFINILIIV